MKSELVSEAAEALWTNSTPVVLVLDRKWSCQGLSSLEASCRSTV
jgi:hypothetical protein